MRAVDGVQVLYSANSGVNQPYATNNSNSDVDNNAVNQSYATDTRSTVDSNAVTVAHATDTRGSNNAVDNSTANQSYATINNNSDVDTTQAVDKIAVSQPPAYTSESIISVDHATRQFPEATAASASRPTFEDAVYTGIRHGHKLPDAASNHVHNA